jgi:ATP-binding cassette, subfamily B, bacterial
MRATRPYDAAEMRQVWSAGFRTVALVKRLVAYLSDESPALLAIGSATAVAQSVLLIPIALLVRDMFDSAIPHHDTGAIVLDGLVILALYAVSAALGYAARVAAIRTAAAAGTRLRRDVLSKLYTLPQSWHDTHRSGDVHAIGTQDTERAQAMLATVAGVMIPAVVVAVALVVVALLVSPLLFGTTLVVVPPLLIGARLLLRRMRARQERWSQSSRRFSAELQLLLRALQTARVAGSESWELERGGQRASELAAHYRGFGTSVAAVNALQNAIAAAAGTIVLIVGGIAVADHSMTLGDLLAFYAVLALLLRQLHAVGFQSDLVVIGLRSLDDIESLLAIDVPSPYGEGGRSIAFRGAVSLAGVSFAYGETPTLTDVELTIDAAERVVIVGPNGAGKSTLVNLLLGLYAPQAGAVRADGLPFDELDIRELRRQIGVVLQDPVLLHGTIRENIAYAQPDATDDDVRTAAATATAADFIEALPQGYATPVGDEGAGLSGGQRQRIAIARALMGTPALLILDEPTTYLDDRAVHALLDRLLASEQAPTVLLITHDPHVAAYADRVVELRDGRVVSDARRRDRGYRGESAASDAATDSLTVASE